MRVGFPCSRLLESLLHPRSTVEQDIKRIHRRKRRKTVHPSKTNGPSVEVPETPQGTSKNKSQGKGLLCIVAGTYILPGRRALEQTCSPPKPSALSPRSSIVSTSSQTICPSPPSPKKRAPSLQRSPPSPSNLVSLSHLLDFPAPTHHRVQTDPAVKGGSREHWRVPRAPLHIKAPAALRG